MLYPDQEVGTLGSMYSVSPRLVNPRIPSNPTRYLQLAEPVHQVQPPRPSWPSAVYTSAATTYGSTLYASTSSGVRVWVSGLIIWYSSKARSPFPWSAVANTAQSAAWVYWAPFSRTPGR